METENRFATASATGREGATQAPEPASVSDRPYAHLTISALRDAARKATVAARATTVAAEKAEATAGRAEQQAAAGAGPNTLALSRRQQDVAQRAVAIREVRALGSAITGCTDRLHRTEARIQQLEQRLAETGRFGRPVLRGEDRAAVEAGHEELLRTRQEDAREMEQMSTRLHEVTQQAGPVGEYEVVLAEAGMSQTEKATLKRRAQDKDNQAAGHLRAEAVKARKTSDGAAYRHSGLRRELSVRGEENPPVSAEGNRHQLGRDDTPASPYPGRADVNTPQPHDGRSEPPTGPLL
jgi:hypothetical protein